MLMARPTHRRLLFIFSLYLFFAVTMVAFDPHGAIPSKTCAICFMGSSLSSAVGQAHVTGEVYCDRQYVRLAEEICRVCCLNPFSAVSYRGPPLPSASL
jgi:hypothetical protein